MTDDGTPTEPAAPSPPFDEGSPRLERRRRWPSGWWLSPVLTVGIAALAGLGTWYTIVGDLQAELAALKARQTAVEARLTAETAARHRAEDLVEKKLTAIETKLDRLLLIMVGDGTP